MLDAKRQLLLKMFNAAVDAARPEKTLAAHLPNPPNGKTVVIGAGKAAASMAKEVVRLWPKEAPLSGLVVTRYGHGVGPLERIDVIEAGHPVPDAAGQEAAARIFSLAGEVDEHDLLLCLISGGGSALLTLPVECVSLETKREINQALLRSGATIQEINCVRKHLSRIKGGRLAARAGRARIVTLLISDVPGDDPSVIASGPTIADSTTTADARAVLDRYGICVPSSVATWLNSPEAETPKAGDPALTSSEYRIIATPWKSLEAAAAVARAAGVTPVLLGDTIEGESSDVASVMAAIARACDEHGTPATAPCVLISGGETTVTVTGRGRGGRNAEFLLALAVALDGHKRIFAFAGDTDGIDGTEDNAGAMIDPDTLQRAQACGLDPRRSLADNDGYGFFETLGDLIFTGPTRTNVNDFRAILIR